MVNDYRELCLVKLLEHTVLVENLVRKHLERNRQLSASIYDIIDQRTRGIPTLLSNSNKETDGVCKMVIRNYHKIIELKKGLVSDQDIPKIFEMILREITTHFNGMESAMVKLETGRINFGFEFRDTDPYDSGKILRVLSSTLDSGSPNRINRGSLVLLSEKLNKLCMMVETAEDQLNKQQLDVKESVDRLVYQLDKSFYEYELMQKQELAKATISLKDVLDILVKNRKEMDSSNIQTFLLETEIVFLSFLEKFGIEIMDTEIGDKFNSGRHQIIREIPGPVKGKSAYTIAGIHKIGFIKDGSPFYPSMVIVQS